LLRGLFRSESAASLKPRFDRALWQWLRRWQRECELERFRTNKARMQRVGFYSRALLGQLREQYQLEYERAEGLLQLFRSARDLKLAEPALALLAEHGVPHSLLDAEAARAVEPGLSVHTPLAAALHLAQDESGNCPLFARHMKHVAGTLGVQFHLGETVEAIEPESRGVALRIDGKRFPSDAVVVAAGAHSVGLLKPLGIEVPLYPVRGYSITATIKNYDQAPHGVVIDETYKTSVTRMGARVRVAGTAELGLATPALQQRALRTLAKVADDWFPQAAQYSGTHSWSGVHPMLPDGAPLLGSTPVRDVYLNIGHGSEGWAMAAGSGKIVADVVSGREPEIDLEGLTLRRYG
jgi:D-amino-acid dehydrogenase